MSLETILVLVVILLFNYNKFVQAVEKALSFTNPLKNVDRNQILERNWRAKKGLLFHSSNRAIFHAVAVLPLHCSVAVHFLAD